MFVAAMALEVVRIVTEEVDRLLRLAERFHAVLADLERKCCGNLIDTRLDDVGDATHQSQALRDRRGAPGRKRRLRRPHRASASSQEATAKSPSTRSLIDRTAPLDIVRRGNVGAIDEQRMACTESRAHGRERRIEALMHRSGGSNIVA